MQSEPCSVDVRYIPLRKQKVLTRPSYIDLQMGRGLSIAGRDLSRELTLLTASKAKD